MNDEIDYRKQVTDKPKLQEILKTAAGHFQSILNVAQGMEAFSSLGASHLGNTNSKNFRKNHVFEANKIAHVKIVGTFLHG